MGKIESTMRSEIQRLARKEIKSAVDPLAKEVRELRRRVNHLNKVIGPLERQAKKYQKETTAKLGTLKATEEEVRAARITAEWVANLRMKLNLSQAELATLVGVSVSAVRSWEYDVSKPREAPRSALVALRKLGRRDVLRLLEAQAEEE